MATFIVTYDLLKAGQNYDAIITKIKSYGTWCHIQESVWAIQTNQSAAVIRDNLRTTIDGNDKLYVARLEGEAAWAGYSAEISNWFKSYA